MAKPFRVYVGWDEREAEAYNVCAHSIRRRASIPVEIHPIRLQDLRAAGAYWRTEDPLASTQFTYSRFLAPMLAGFEGFALYCDCDFLWLGDIAGLAAMTSSYWAVACVQHDYHPRESIKMDGRVQSDYPRKNWSSLMLFNCAHPATRRLTPECVNCATGAYLHRMQWAKDDEIGALPVTWNWLEGWYDRPDSGKPNAVHFTRGGPWFDDWRHVEYADDWLSEREQIKLEQL